MRSDVVSNLARIPLAAARRELRLLLGGRRWVALTALLVGYALALALVSLILWDRWSAGPVHEGKIARRVVLVLCLVETSAIVLLGPILGAPSLTRERARSTLDALVAAGVRGPALVLGKFAALLAVACPFLLIPLPNLWILLGRGRPFATSFPFTSRVMLLGLVVGLLAVGILSSSLFDRSRRSWAMALAITAGVVVSPVLGRPLVRWLPRPERAISALLTPNPFVGMASLAQFDIMRAGPIYAATPVGETAFSYPDWGVTLGVWVGGAVLALALASWVLDRRRTGRRSAVCYG